MNSAWFPLTGGWKLHISGDADDLWIGVTGEHGELAAFACKADSVRGCVLRELLIALLESPLNPRANDADKT